MIGLGRPEAVRDLSLLALDPNPTGSVACSKLPTAIAFAASVHGVEGVDASVEASSASRRRSRSSQASSIVVAAGTSSSSERTSNGPPAMISRASLDASFRLPCASSTMARMARAGTRTCGSFDVRARSTAMSLSAAAASRLPRASSSEARSAWQAGSR